MKRIGVIILIGFMTLIVGLTPIPAFAFQQVLDIPQMPFTGTVPDGITSLIIPTQAGNSSSTLYYLESDYYIFGVGSTSSAMALNRNLVTTVLAPNTRPTAMTVEIKAQSTNAACNNNLKHTIMIYFYSAGDTLLYNNGNGRTYEQFYDASSNEVIDYQIDFSSITATGQSFALSEATPAKIVFGFGFSCANIGAGTKYTEAEVHAFSFTYDFVEDIDLLRPLLASDEWTGNVNGTAYWEETPSGQTNYQSPVIMFSNSPGAHVYSVAPGTVTYVGRITNQADCILFSTLECFARLGVNGSPPLSIYLTSGYWWGDDKDIWKVVVSTTAGDLHYVVSDAGSYVALNQEIEANCIVGRTMQATYFSFPSSRFPISEGVAVLGRFKNGAKAEVKDHFTSNPVQGVACNADESIKNCMGDVTLSSPSDWSTQGSVTFKEPFGAMIGRSSNIASARPFNLNPNRAPQVKVSARNVTGINVMRVKIGETEQSFTLSSSYKSYLISGDAHVADVGGYYTIAVYNDGDGTIELEYLCVSNTLQSDEETPVPPPPPNKDGCYFNDQSFDANGDGWSRSSGVQTLTGALGVPHLGEIGQNVLLYPDGASAQTYTIKVRASLWHNTLYLPAPDKTTDMTVQYNWNSGGWTTINTYTDGQIASVEFGVVTYQATFNVATETNGSFVLRVTMGASPTGLQGLIIRDVCIQAGDTTDGSPGEDFPGFDDPENPPGTPPDRPLPEYCASTSLPQGDGFGGWIVWLWGNLNEFFQCDLMVILNDIYQAIMRFFRMVGWFFRWVMTVIQMFINWMTNSVLPWLAGYMVNLMGSQVGDVLYTSNPSPGGNYQQCQWYDIFCHAGNLFSTIGGVITGIGDFLGGLIQGVIDVIGWLLNGIVDVIEWLWARLSELIGGIINIIRGLIDIIGQALNWIIQAIGSVIGFFVNIVATVVEALVNFARSVLEWVGTALAVLGAIITGASTATPQTVPGLPSCTTPESHALCLIYWALENTVLAGLGSFFIPIVSAIIMIRFAIWYVSRIRKMFVDAVLVS